MLWRVFELISKTGKQDSPPLAGFVKSKRQIIHQLLQVEQLLPDWICSSI